MGMEFREFAMMYLDHARIYNAEKTMDGKERYVRRFVESLGDRELAYIARADIERYIQARKAAGAGNPTINREISTLKNLFNYAIDLGYLECNPVKGVRLLPEQRKPLHLPTHAEVERWLLWCLQNDPLLYDISAIAVNTGLRRGDVLKIRGEDIDLDRRILAVAVSKTRAVHYLPINEAAYRVLAARKSRAGPGYIFTNGNGNGRGHLKGFRRRFRRAKSATGFPCRFHDFRRFFASEIHGRGASIRTVQKLLGHARVATTELYVDETAGARRQAVESLEWDITKRKQEYTLFEM
jgi:integrase